MNEELMHYGTPQTYDGDPHGSGRYRKGSGDNPYQDTISFKMRVDDYRKSGMSDKEIAELMGMKSGEFRSLISIAKEERIAAERSQAIRLKDKGYSNTEIGRIMGVPESTVRNRLKPVLDDRETRITDLSKRLEEQVSDKTYLDVGKGVERQLGVSKQNMDAAVNMLVHNGYKKHYLSVEQATNPGQKTPVIVLTKDDVEWKEVYKNRDKVLSPDGIYSEDKGRTYSHIEPPVSIDSKRIQVRYAEDGGKEKDGVIELRRGVADISLGQSRYAQVRVAVDGTHYLKGMAMYSDNLPDGVDILFNTNKTKDIPMLGTKDNSVLKPIKADKDNPFGATVRQFKYKDANGEEHLSPMNIVNDDSDWNKWSRSLSSQFLSKQEPSLAKRQLDFAYQDRKREFENICQLTNPAVKKKLLLSFADECDSAAVNLKAAALPRQQTQVILPITSLKDNEVYAPNYKNGEEIVLVRYPHGGIFEIPRLTVNNNNPEGKSLLGKAEHAIGINSHVAERLSGADFDGDTVIAIPTKGQKIRTSQALEGLKNFDPQERYKAYPGMKPVDADHGFNKQREMGQVSNLITDMTLKGATEDELARAVRHSMVVIDAEKHQLNWRQSYNDNAIAQLKEKYQGGKNKGASTLISKAKREYAVPARKEFVPDRDIDPNTGKINWKETGETYTNKKGKVVPRTDKSTWMAEFGPEALSSGTRMESYYVDYANKVLKLADDARKEYKSTPNMKVNASARRTYSAEVISLDKKLNSALLNAPRERQAQLLADHVFKAKKKANPGMTKEEEKREKARIIQEARSRVGALSRQKRNIDITDREWEAIQAGAISNNKLTQIIANTDEDKLKERATPRSSTVISSSMRNRIKQRADAGYSQAEIAESLGISTSTVNKIINE